jgi:iron complex outermembrane receptor protein
MAPGMISARAACAAALVLGASPLAAQPEPSQRVVISVRGDEQRAFDTPYAIDIVDAQALRAAGPMVNLSEAMARVPGLVVNLRHNYAQDLQIHSRGFGARATFGVRGMRLYTDGIPATMPDGQGQVSHFDLAGAERVEVLRGPFSALYGNSSGGVISLVSAPAAERAFAVDVDAGSHALRQARASVEAPLGGGFDLRAGASRFETDGPRVHGAARRGLANLRGGWRSRDDNVTLLANRLDVNAQDPLGLTRAQFDADPTQTAPQAIAFDTRKTIAQSQLGANWQHRFDAGALDKTALVVYAGRRRVTQWQSIPPDPQANPSHPGGVIDFERDYAGVDVRAFLRWSAVSLVVGAAREEQHDDRRGFENFVGTPPDRLLGVTGALRRDESNRSRTTDAYAQGEVGLGAGLAATLGVRRGELQARTRDRYLGNGDDSGTIAHRYTNPVAALRWRAAPSLNLYVSAARGFESPTLTELAYRPDGGGGFNTELKPQKSKQVELGAKWRGDAASIDAALFRADTRDEIAVLQNVGGRSTFHNVGRTRRDGVEVGASWSFAPRWRVQAALTWLDARYRDAFGNGRIAGTVRESGFAEVAWRPRATTEVALEARAQGRVPVNDLNSDFAAGVAVVNLRALHRVALPVGTLELLARVDNVADRGYAGSVIVNEGNARYFEPAAGRTWLASARWRVGW